MSLLIACIILFVLAAGIAVILEKKIMETLFLAVAFVVAVLYVFGLSNQPGSLLLGIYFLVLLSLFSVVYLGITVRKNKEKVISSELLQGGILFLGFIAIAFLMNYGRTFRHWDEFTHWGAIVKHFFYNDAFGTFTNPNYTLVAANYPPALSIFQYFASRFSTEFSEHYSYMAINMFYFTMIMPFFTQIFKPGKILGNILKLIMLFLMPQLLPLAFYLNFYMINYGSGIAGLLFGFVILYYFYYEFEKEVYGVLMVCASLFLLTNVLNISVLFSFGVMVVISVDLIIRYRAIKSFILERDSVRATIGRIGVLVSPAVTTIVTFFSWTLLLRTSQTALNAEVIGLSQVTNFFTRNLTYQQRLTRSLYFFAIFNRPIPFLGLSAFAISIAFSVVVIALCLFIKSKQLRIRIMIGGFILLIGQYLYLFVFALVYVYLFYVWEQIRLNAFERYVSTYLLGMLSYIGLILLLIAKNELEMDVEGKVFHLKRFVFLGIISLTLLFVVCKTWHSYDIITRRTPERYMAAVAERWMDYFIETPPYVIDQGNTIWNLILLEYELIPHTRIANVKRDHSISLEPYFTGWYFPYDPITFIVTPQEWAQHVYDSRYETIYILNKDEILEEVYGHFFIGGIQEDMLYKVYFDEGELQLIPFY